MKRAIVIILTIATIIYSCTNPKTNDVSIEKTEIEKLIERCGIEAVVEFKGDWFSGIFITNISNIYANYEEQAIINNMNCWGADWNSGLFVPSDRNLTEEQREKRRKKDVVVVRALGRKQLYNDTVFINIVRNDSLYNALLDKRKEIAKSLSIHKNKVPFFKTFIDRINKDIIEYDCYGSVYWDVKKPHNPNYTKYDYTSSDCGGYYACSEKGLGIYEEKFYNNYSDLLKEEYEKRYETSNVKDEDIIDLNSILKSLEKLDRALWAVKYYKASKNALEKKKEEENKSKQKEEHLEKLF